MEAVTTDLLLVRCRRPSPEGLKQAVQRFADDCALPLVVQRVTWSPDGGWAYAYFALVSSMRLEASSLPRLVSLWMSLCDCTDADVARLERLQDLPGRSQGERPSHHYVVETDPEDGWQEELSRWYVDEHMPGLARVPGCVDARRYRNHDGGPSSHACYSLVAQDTLGSPAWLAVRGTKWSSRVRPHFTNTRRTMMQIVK